MSFIVSPIYILLRTVLFDRKIKQAASFLYWGKMMAGFIEPIWEESLQQRNIALNAKQRRLLLLIDHEDFQTLNTEFKNALLHQNSFNNLLT